MQNVFSYIVKFINYIIHQMKGIQYPTIDWLINQIVKNLKDQCSPSDFQFEIKYAKLKSQRTFSFTKLLNESENSIVILNGRPDYKSYRINANATKIQYQTLINNCKKLKQVDKQKNIVKLDLKFGDEKMSKIVDQQNWIAANKQRKINNQINLLIDQKQFRIDLCIYQVTSQNAQLIIKKFNEKLSSVIKVMRFIDSTVFYTSPYYFIKASQIYQSEDDNQKKTLFGHFSKDKPEQVDKYILSKIPRNSKANAKYQIQLILNQEGVLHVMKLIKKPQQLNKFIGDILEDFKNLSSNQYKTQKKQENLSKLMNDLKI